MSTAKTPRSGKASTEKGGAGDAPKDVKVTMAFPVTTYQKTLYFNRFRLEAIDSHVMMTFGMVRPSGEVLCCFRCSISKLEITDTKQSLTTFMATQLEGFEPASTHSFEAPGSNPNMVDIPVVNEINVGVQAERNTTEVVLSRYSMLTVANVSRMDTLPKPTIPVEGVALLRCEPALFKLFLVKLYDLAEGVAP